MSGSEDEREPAADRVPLLKLGRLSREMMAKEMWWEEEPFLQLARACATQISSVPLQDKYIPLSDFFEKVTERCRRLMGEQMTAREIQTLCRIPEWVEELARNSTPSRPLGRTHEVNLVNGGSSSRQTLL